MSDDIATITASYSKLTTHRRCPQQYFYSRILKLEESGEKIAPERDFGSWWSILRAGEAAERGRKLESLKQDPETEMGLPDDSTIALKDLTVEVVMERAERWWNGHKALTNLKDETAEEIWQTKLNGDLPTLLSNALERHLTRWADDIATEHPLGVEVYWQKQLPAPKSDPWQTEYPKMFLTGYVDEIYWDASRKMVVVRDHKTSKDIEQNSSVSDMMDSQLHLYAWGVNDLVKQWTKQPIRAVAYDRMRSIPPKAPSLTNSGRLRMSGGQPAVGMTDLKTYLDWVASKPEFPGTKKDGSGAGIYELEEAVVEKLKSGETLRKWFQRTLSPLNRNIIQTHLRAAVDSSVDAYRTQYRAELTSEAQRNLGKHCGFCEFADLCRAQMIGGAHGTYNLEEYGLQSREGLTLLDGGTLIKEPQKATNDFDL